MISLAEYIGLQIRFMDQEDFFYSVFTSKQGERSRQDNKRARDFVNNTIGEYKGAFKAIELKKSEER